MEPRRSRLPVRSDALTYGSTGGVEMTMPQTEQPPVEPPVESLGQPLEAQSVAEEAALAPPFVNQLAGASLGDDPVEDSVTAAAVEAVPVPLPPSDDGSAARIEAELAGLRSLVERMALRALDMRVDAGPTALHDARSRLIDQGVGASVMLPVLDELADSMVADSSQRMVLQTLQRKLVAKLPPPTMLELGRLPLVIFVVGASGAGKTTLAAKLASELAASRGLRVTIAGIDVARAGAPQQLMALGTAVGIGVRLCYSPGELRALVAEDIADVIVVDTPANDGTRRDRTAELRAFSQVVAVRSTLLVLPAVTKDSDLLRHVGALAETEVDGLVLTRCDETTTYGALLTAAAETQIGITYSTHSGELRDPLHAGDNQALSLAVVSGRWPDRSAVNIQTPARA